MTQIEDYSTEQRHYINMMEKDIEKAKQLQKSTGFVVAGWGGDTYYCYVGEGNGYKGSSFFPMTTKAIIFDTEKEAQDHCYEGYRNGNGKGDLLDLHPVKASDFFEKCLAHQEKSLNWALEMWDEFANTRK